MLDKGVFHHIPWCRFDASSLRAQSSLPPSGTPGCYVPSPLSVTSAVPACVFLPLAPNVASQSPENGVDDALMLLPLETGVSWSEGSSEALADRDHSKAADLLAAMDLSTLPGPTVGDHAFVLAWSLIRADRGTEAVQLLSRLESASVAPADYLALTRAEVHLAKASPVRAARELESIPEDSLLHARAGLVRAKSLSVSGRTRDAMAAYEALVERPDPAEGNNVALLALAKKRGLSNPDSQEFFRRLRAHYPLTSKAKKPRRNSSAKVWATNARSTERSRALMSASAWRSIMRFLGPIQSGLTTPTEINCEMVYILGRAYFKKNEVTKAAALLGPAGRRCNSATPDLGPKMLYLAGKSAERKKEWAAAAQHYLEIPRLYPDHSYADDGFALGGIAANEAGQTDKALDAWSTQVDRYPTGDNAGEAFWRLAWGAYLRGDTPAALSWAERTIRELPIEVIPSYFGGSLLGRSLISLPGPGQSHSTHTGSAALSARAPMGSRRFSESTTRRTMGSSQPVA